VDKVTFKNPGKRQPMAGVCLVLKTFNFKREKIGIIKNHLIKKQNKDTGDEFYYI